ncbi:MAG TPA: hypothetical protein VID50_03140, partial [Candidatus Eisenbacteria bacterium]
RFPAYLVKGGERITLVEKRRGDSEPAPDQLTLRRSWWLDFDGRGGTVHDTMTGALSRAWRLEMQPPAVLGRVAIDGQDQFITGLGAGAPAGVEVRQGALKLEADSRYSGGMAELPAVGWAQDFREVSGILHLGPGWRLFHASGVDEVSPTWISTWTLLDLFLVLILTLSAARLWGLRSDLLALAALGFTWIEPGAPRWSWVAAVACLALIRVFPPKGKFHAALRVLMALAFVSLVVVAIPFMIRQVRNAIYPALEEPFAWMRAFGTGGRMAPVTAPPQEVPAGDEQAAAREGEISVTSELEEDKRAGLERGVLSKLDAAYVLSASRADLSNLLYHDPRTVVQTGPGIPSWGWREVSLRWRGPVERGQRLRLFLLPPALNSLLAFLRTGLVLALGLMMFRPRGGAWSSIAAMGIARALVLLPILALSIGAARAEFPSDALLESLRGRLLAKAECFPECASSPRLALEAAGSDLRLRVEILSAADTAVPLPGGSAEWPERVLLDGAPAPGLLREPGGRLWIPV